MYNPYQYNPYHFNQPQQYNPNLNKHTVLRTVEPFVQYGLHEAKHTSFAHALREVAAITYLMGMGYDPKMAHRIVESWEINEVFYPGQRFNS
ncbi:hypothetical protein [Neobacillus sp. DY30]|uniref:hypothetical protein n=1 Tax=Neobacillus sp. DY30 TaxID=3047871 RepID=UPI0024BF6DA2|nr:hypothetical protein [Neobacillus sp. DY30]WHY03065.1 hypothetical protein QNH29_12965 [Neobacillus sp. DY30]